MISIFAGETVLLAQQGLHLTPSIFLAGPTPRDAETPSWRPEALRLLGDQGWQGRVFVPEPRNGPMGKWPDPNAQTQWEYHLLTVADCIAFWIPRNMKDMPGLTTNIEFGLFARSKKVVLGFPSGAEKVGSNEFYARLFGISVWGDLSQTMDAARALAEGGGW